MRELILLLVLVAVLVPVIFRLTEDPQFSATTRPESKSSVQGLSTTIHLQFAHAPSQASIGHEGEVLWSQAGTAAQTEHEAQIQLNFHDPLVELPVAVQWPEGTPRSAVTIRFEPEGMEAREVTFWGEGTLNEFIELHWDE